MRVLLITLLIGFCSLVKAQYPNPLPSSGELKMSQIITWMTAAGQLDGSSPPYSLLFLHNRSTLEGNDVYLTKWYGYSIISPPVSIDGSELEANIPEACASFISTIYYLKGGTELVVGNTVYMDDTTTSPLQGGTFLTAFGDWVRVDIQGVILQIGNCL